MDIIYSYYSICFDLRPVMTHVESDDAHAPHVHATLHDDLYNVCTWSYSRQVHIWEALISDGITDQSFPDVMPVLPRLL